MRRASSLRAPLELEPGPQAAQLEAPERQQGGAVSAAPPPAPWADPASGEAKLGHGRSGGGGREALRGHFGQQVAAQVALEEVHECSELLVIQGAHDALGLLLVALVAWTGQRWGGPRVYVDPRLPLTWAVAVVIVAALVAVNLVD